MKRIKQFLKGLTAKITPEEYQWIQNYLTKQEYYLFLKLRRDEQRHCIDVAKNFKEKEMIRLGLLHDIGKIVYPLNLIEKSLMVIGDKLTHHHLKYFKKVKMVKGYYEHPVIGAELLSQLGNDNPIFLRRVKLHHSHTNDKKLNAFQKIDALN